MAARDEATAPYFDAVAAYGHRGPARFHVPGHKGGPGADAALREALGDALALDVPQDIEGIDLGPQPTPYQQAEQLAAEAYGAGRSWFLTNGASQGNHALCLALAPLGTRCVVQRNSHASLVDGLVLSGGVPTYVRPEYERELGIALCVTPQALRDALAATPEAHAAFVVSPTYYGIVADVGACAEVAHEAGAALVVDQAWGSHFGFHPQVPESALRQGADAVLTSTHKVVGSLTQSAILHVAAGGRVDPGVVGHAVRLVRSTSQSSLLMSSLDAARRQLAARGERLLAATLAAAAETRAAIDAIPGCRVVGEDLAGRPGAAAWDPVRLVVDVRGTGATGYELAHALQQTYDLHVELATSATLVMVLGLAEPAEPLARLPRELAAVAREAARPGTVAAAPHPGMEIAPQIALPPRDAFLGESERVRVERAEGRISCESIAGYPPGIPALLPGERITPEVIDYLTGLRELGARLHGASDPDFRTIFVLR